MFSLSSCGKENIPSGGGSKEDGPLVIKLAHASTKTYLDVDGVTPKFKAGDKIRVFQKSSGNKVNDYEVSINDGVATITIPEEDKDKVKNGNIEMVYPAERGVSKYSPVLKTYSFRALIPGEQHGTFEESNLCVAHDLDFDSGYAIFELQAPVLRFDLNKLPVDVEEIMLYCEGAINDETGEAANYIQVTNFDKDTKVCYVVLKTITKQQFAIFLGGKVKVKESAEINNSTLYDVDLRGWSSWDDYE